MALASVGSADGVLARITGLVAAMTPEGLNVWAWVSMALFIVTKAPRARRA